MKTKKQKQKKRRTLKTGAQKKKGEWMGGKGIKKKEGGEKKKYIGLKDRKYHFGKHVSFKANTSLINVYFSRTQTLRKLNKL